MVKIGVLGAGHLGKVHIKLLKEIKDATLVGFYDQNEATAIAVEKDLGVKHFPDMDSLLNEVEALDIVTPTISHFDLASQAINKSKHVFIEKPLTNTLEEARQLLALVEEAHVKVQVGHVERFNPAFLSVKNYDLRPVFIETHRLAQFNPRGTDVAVVLDLMIHDIDIILQIVKSPVKRISASGVAVISNSPDIANARIEFDNGCVANITASRISLKVMRKMRIFQRDAYISIDFSEKKSEIVRLSDSRDNANPFSLEINTGKDSDTKFITFDRPEILPINSIKMELELFIEAILHDKETPVTLMDGCNAMDVAYQILDRIEKNNPS
jgi:predicted dehydrogenase